MPLDSMESVAAVLREGPIFGKVQEFTSNLPPVADRKATDYAPIGGWKPGTKVYRILQEVDDPVHNLADIIEILEIDGNSALGMQMAALDILITDIKD